MSIARMKLQPCFWLANLRTPYSTEKF